LWTRLKDREHLGIPLVQGMGPILNGVMG